MTAGLRTWDSQGRLTLDITDSLTVMLGATQVGTSDGSLAVPGIDGRDRVWAQFVPDQGDSPAYNQTLPRFTISGSTVAWTFNQADGFPKVGGLLIYGRY